MIAHCILEEWGDGPDYYGTLPIYTRNKDHELCAICVSKE